MKKHQSIFEFTFLRCALIIPYVLTSSNYYARQSSPRPLKKRPIHVILSNRYSNQKISVRFSYIKRKRNVASWLDGTPFLWFPPRQSESRTLFWLLLLSSFSHATKRRCYLIVPACLCQSAQPLSISSQRLSNHRPRKSISVAMN